MTRRPRHRSAALALVCLLTAASLTSCVAEVSLRDDESAGAVAEPSLITEIVYEDHGTVESWEDRRRGVVCYRIEAGDFACATMWAVQFRLKRAP